MPRPYPWKAGDVIGHWVFVERVCEARRRVMWLIEHGYPIFDEKNKAGKNASKISFLL